MAYSYSPIKEIQVRNFRNIGDVALDFTESPIISLIGENESGKTSIVKAFSVAAIHADPRYQKDYIRDGTKGFGVAIILEDGTQVIRMKEPTCNRYIVKKPDGSVWDAVKLESEVPKAVQDVMGLIEEPETKEYLHIRTYEDQLLFVVTPASTNYKVMYNALKISQITKAIKLGSTQANETKREISRVEAGISTLRNSLVSIKTYDIEPLLNVKNKIIEEQSVLAKLDKAMALLGDIKTAKSQLGALQELADSGASQIDILEVERLNRVYDIVNNLETMKRQSGAYLELANIGSIDEGEIYKINEAAAKKSEMESMIARSKTYLDLVDLDSISEIQLSKLLRASDLMRSIQIGNESLSVIDTSEISEIDLSEFDSIAKMDRALNIRYSFKPLKDELEQIERYNESVIAWMKSIGVATASCPKCGESIVIDTSGS